MRRRTLLATLGSVLVAGCGSSDDSLSQGPSDILGEGYAREGVEPVDSIGMDRPPEMDGDLGTEPIDDIGIERNISINRDVGIGSGRRRQDSRYETDTPTETNPRATEYLDAAREYLTAALDAYVEFGGGESLVDVNPTVGTVVAVAVQRPVTTARKRLESAREYATEGQQIAVLGLQHVASFLEYSAATDQMLCDAYEEFVFAIERAYNENTTQARQARLRLDSKLETAEASLQTLTDGVDRGAMVLFEALSESAVVQKQQQLSSSVSTLRDFESGVEYMEQGLSRLDDAGNRYRDGNYSGAADSLIAANGNFAGATTQFKRVSSETGLKDKALEARLVTRTLEQVTADLERSVNAKANGNQLVSRESRRSAEDQLDSNDVVADMTAWSRFGI